MIRGLLSSLLYRRDHGAFSVLPLIPCDHVDNSTHPIKIELPSSKGWHAAIDVVVDRLVARYKSVVDITLAPKALVNCYELSVSVVHHL